MTSSHSRRRALLSVSVSALALLVAATGEAQASKYEKMDYDALQAYHQQDPGQAKAAKVLADRSIQRGRYARAKEAWENVIASGNTKEHNTARLALAGIYMKLQDFGEAKRLAKEVLASSPTAKEKKAAKKLVSKVGEKLEPHVFGGSLKFVLAHDSNAASASSKAGKAGRSRDDDEDEDEDDFEDEEEDDVDDDVLDDILDDLDLDDDDLDDQGFDDDDGDFFDEDEEGDLDGDGIIDDEDGDGVPDAPEDEVAGDPAADPVAADPAALVEQAFASVSRAARRPIVPPKSVPDQRGMMNVGGKYRYALSDQGDVWQAAFNYGGSDNRDQQKLDRYTVAFNTGPIINFPDWRLRLSPSVTYVELQKTGKHIMSSYVAAVKLDYLFNPDLTLSAKYGHEYREFEGVGAPEVNANGFKFGASYKLTEDDTIAISYAPKIENSTKDTSDKDQWGMALGYNRALPWDMFAGATVDYKRVELDKAKTPQEDDVYGFNATIGKKLPNDIFIAATFIDMNRDSNLQGKSKNNQSFLLTTGWKF